MRRSVSAKAAAQRRRRARMTEAERQAEAERNAAQQRARRQREAVRAAEAERMAEQQRVRRAAQGEEERQAEREAHAERHRQQRAAQDEAARQAELAANAERMRQQRAAQEEEQRRAEREAHAERHRQLRAAQEEEARQAEREANAERLRQQRAAQEEEARQAEREANARRDEQRRAVARGQQASFAARRPALVLSGAQLVDADDIGGLRLDRPCAKCGAVRWAGERDTLCCAGGTVRLDPLPAPPPLLRHLWTDDGVEARTFRQYSRHLNSALALSSLSVREVPPPAGTGGYAPCMVVQGRVYQRLGPVQARPDQVPTFGQIYVHDPQAEDPDVEAAIRLGHVRLPAATSNAVQRRLLALLRDLQAILRDSNPYVQDFITAAEILADEVEHRRLVISAAARPAGEHQRRYNAAEGLREVAVLMGDAPAQHDLVLRRRAVDGVAALQFIDETHR